MKYWGMPSQSMLAGSVFSPSACLCPVDIEATFAGRGILTKDDWGDYIVATKGGPA